MKTQISQNSGVGAFNFSSGEHLTSEPKLATSKSQASPPARNRPSGQFFDPGQEGPNFAPPEGGQKVDIANRTRPRVTVSGGPKTLSHSPFIF